MIPINGAFTVVPVTSDFLPPLDESYTPLLMRAPGGIAINNGSQGREVQFWTVSYDGAHINVDAEMSGSGSYVLPVAGVLACCLAFDSNMAVAIGYMTASGGHLYYFDSLTGSYQTLDFPRALSCRVAVDKTNAFYSAKSDVIFAYVRDDDTVQYRQQRDRYAIDYPVGVANGETLIRVGPSVDNRLQLQLIPGL